MAAIDNKGQLKIVIFTGLRLDLDQSLPIVHIGGHELMEIKPSSQKRRAEGSSLRSGLCTSYRQQEERPPHPFLAFSIVAALLPFTGSRDY
ncbi:hypothetical protein DPEC_G00310130 [Dallia pectoralis]|uniref:Uncharacterized protein n=1 Tax=Dallia pectoralis TaxID=75939 RepID=A0ACC2FF79_DALPE|nr:hypothetical protein DPEC_G00310130 [Dallia pectoralis]